MKQPLLLLVALAWIWPQWAVALDPGRSLAQYHHTRWTQIDGAPSDILAIAQSGDGLLWLGASGGLYRFDGVRFDHIEPIPHDRARSDQVRCLLIDRNGAIWVGYRRGGLALFRDHRLQPMPFPGGKDAILQILSAPDGAIWVVTGSPHAPIVRYADGHWSSFRPESGFDGQFVSSVAFTPNGDLLAAGSKTLYLRRPGQSSFVPTSVPITIWSSLAIDDTGQPWISDQNGLRPVKGTGGVGASAELAPIPAPQSDTYTPIYFDHHGVLWAATTGGLGRLRPGEKALELFGAKQGLSGDVAHTVMEDREGNVWVGTNAGLDRLRAANVTRELDIPTGPNQLFHITNDHRGTVYISNENALFRVAPGSRPTLIRDGLDLPRALCYGVSGMWVTASDRLWHETGSVLQAIPTPTDIATSEGCAEDHTGAVWLAEGDRGLWRYASGRWQDVKPPGVDFDENHASHVGVDERGRLLAYVEGLGIARIDGLKFSVPWRFKDLPIGNSIFMDVDHDDIFVGGQYGLARLRGPSTAVLSADRFPWLRNTSWVAKSSKGETWLVTGAGVSRVSSRSLEAAFDDPHAGLTPEHFELADGVPGRLTTGAGHGGALGATVGGDGRFWFFGDEGVAFVDPARLSRNRLPPSVLINTVTTDGVARAATSGLVLPKGSSNLEIDYTATSLSIPERVHFRYRMQGVDLGWIDPGSRRQAFYTKLGPSNYQFQVIAANNDGIWNDDGAVLNFRIPPTFLQSWNFLALCIVTGGFLLWWLYLIRMRQVAERVRDRLEHRISERERIARELHDTLLGGFQGLLLRFQAAADTIPANHGARLKMDSAMDLAETVLCEGRDRVWNLRSAQASGGLAEALSLAAARLISEPAVAHVQETGQVRPLTAIVREEACRIGEEAIANAIRHADATLIEIDIEYGSHQLRMSIIDNGPGVEPEILRAGERAGHFGLVGMRERAKQIKGELTIVNRPGAGAQVSLLVPFSVAYSDVSGRTWISALRSLAVLGRLRQ
jgi:signal transduction histidine kinase/ligand-binding sensor domain-containing protein